MLPELSPAVARALDRASAYARQSENSWVEALHLIHGLLEEDEGRAVVVCLAAGLDYARYRDELPMPALEANPALPLHSGVERAFRQARILALELLSEQSVVSEALVLALLRMDLSARAYLERFGLDFARLEANLVSEQPPPVPLEEPLRLDDWTEPMQLGRILDASRNRAGEGLRVVEDYCRFVLNDRFLSGQLKQLRHDLTTAMELLPPGLLLQARDTTHDVGTTLSTAQEGRRVSLEEVVRANSKRVQEALRSLEEYGKLAMTNPLSHHAPGQEAMRSEFSGRLEALRYRSYTLEQAILGSQASRERLANASLYVILSADQCVYSLERTIHEAAAGGASVVQLREKGLSDRDLIKRAQQVRQWTRGSGVLFIVNDRPDIARLVAADGVHLGQDDLSVREAQRILGPDAVVGVSTHDLAQVRQAVLDGASYLGVGAIFPTSTKNVPGYPGLEFVRQALAETSLPLYPIGGINLGNIGELAATGVGRAAVSAAIARAEDPQATARSLVLALAAGNAMPR